MTKFKKSTMRDIKDKTEPFDIPEDPKAQRKKFKVLKKAINKKLEEGEAGPAAPKGIPPKDFKLKACGAYEDEEECPTKSDPLPWGRKSSITDMYLYSLQEGEWGAEENKEYDKKMKNQIISLIKNLKGVDKMDDIRQSMQPSTYDIYLKNVIGDYKGRIDALNSRRVYTFGYEDIKKKLPQLLRRKRKAMSKSIVPDETMKAMKRLMHRGDVTKLDNTS